MPPVLLSLRLSARAGLALVLALGCVPHPVRAESLDALLHRMPADSLVAPLQRFENQAARPADGAEAAMTLGRLHYARGEYRHAAEAFSRAAARLEPARKPLARYWAAQSWLALGDANQARAGFEELAQNDAPLRTEARLGLALAWEESRRPEKALEILEPLAREAHGEIAPAVLERAIAVADQFQRADLASAARQRLFREFPRSIEAARAGLIPPKSVAAAVEIGPYPSEPRAHTAAGQAKAAGFTEVQPMIRGAGSARVYLVRVGGFANAQEAQHAVDRLKRELGLPARVVPAP
jgi:tetratricopeptide (TPR) repeat protein